MLLVLAITEHHGFWGWDGWNALVAIGTISLAAATMALVLGAWRSARATARATALSAYVDLLGEYRNQSMREARARIHDLDECDHQRGLEQLAPADREIVESVSHYLDQLGVLVEKGLLNPDTAATFLGGSALLMWRELAPFIRAERNVNDRPTYQRHFEDLALRFWAMPLDGRIGRLGRMPDLVGPVERPARTLAHDGALPRA